MNLANKVKVDVALIATAALSADGSTSRYFSMAGYDQAMFVWAVTEISPIATSIATIYQAVNGSAAGSAAALASSTAIISAAAKITEFQITMTSAVNTSAITITSYAPDGDARTALTFTGADNLGTAGGTSASARTFGYNDTAAGTAILSNCATNLAALINHSTYGVPGAYASATTTVLVIRPINGGETVFTFTASSTANLVCLTKKAVGAITLKAENMTTSSSFTHLAINVANESATHTAAFLIRAKGRKGIFQQMADLTEM